MPPEATQATLPAVSPKVGPRWLQRAASDESSAGERPSPSAEIQFQIAKGSLLTTQAAKGDSLWVLWKTRSKSVSWEDFKKLNRHLTEGPKAREGSRLRVGDVVVLARPAGWAPTEPTAPVLPAPARAESVPVVTPPPSRPPAAPEQPVGWLAALGRTLATDGAERTQAIREVQHDVHAGTKDSNWLVRTATGVVSGVVGGAGAAVAGLETLVGTVLQPGGAGQVGESLVAGAKQLATHPVDTIEKAYTSAAEQRGGAAVISEVVLNGLSAASAVRNLAKGAAKLVPKTPKVAPIPEPAPPPPAVVAPPEPAPPPAPPPVKPPPAPTEAPRPPRAGAAEPVPSATIAAARELVGQDVVFSDSYYLKIPGRLRSVEWAADAEVPHWRVRLQTPEADMTLAVADEFKIAKTRAPWKESDLGKIPAPTPPAHVTAGRAALGRQVEIRSVEGSTYRGVLDSIEWRTEPTRSLPHWRVTIRTSPGSTMSMFFEEGVRIAPVP